MIEPPDGRPGCTIPAANPPHVLYRYVTTPPAYGEANLIRWRRRDDGIWLADLRCYTNGPCTRRPEELWWPSEIPDGWTKWGPESSERRFQLQQWAGQLPPSKPPRF